MLIEVREQQKTLQGLTVRVVGSLARMVRAVRYWMLQV